jgi:hypothetical protein
MAELGAKAGGCLCGAVRFTATPATHEVDACHCGMCRRWSGGVYLCVPCADVTIEDEATVTAYKSSGYGERVFCKTCGSSLFWRMQDGSMTVVSLQAFDDVSGFVFAEEIFVDSKPTIYEFANDTRKLTGEEFFARAAASQELPGG